MGVGARSINFYGPSTPAGGALGIIFNPPLVLSNAQKNDMSCLMDYHIFQKSHRRSHDDSFSQSIGEMIDFGPRSNSIFFVKTDRVRGGGLLCLSDRARTETARILCAEHLAIPGSLVEEFKMIETERQEFL